MRYAASVAALLLLLGCGEKNPTAPPPDPEPIPSIYPIYAFLGEQGAARWYLICENSFLLKIFDTDSGTQFYESIGRLRDGRAMRDRAWSISYTTGDTTRWASSAYEFEVEHWGDKVSINGTVYHITENGAPILGRCEALSRTGEDGA